MARSFTDRADAVPALAEIFREHGFEGTSLSLISKATGLGKGSLYNFFPGGKSEMMAAVIADIDHWFITTLFRPLETTTDPRSAITGMIRDVDHYFRSGGRVCLVGWLGLGSSRDVFADQVKGYFSRWVTALAHCLENAQVQPAHAARLAEDTVSGIQGAIILSRALDDEAAFRRIISQQQARLLGAIDDNQQRVS